MIDLYAPNTEGIRPRPDERFHLQCGHPEPYCVATGAWILPAKDWLYRKIEWWGIYLEDGTPGWFNSYILLWVIRWYRGNVKHDATRTFMLVNGQLDDGKEPHYDPAAYVNHSVMTTTEKEKLSVRFRWKKPDREVWTAMGNI